jgi:hypothetical protein
MQIFGDPETMAKMSHRFMSATALGNAADGFLRSLPPEAKQLVDRVQNKLADVLEPDGSDSGPANGTDGSASDGTAKSTTASATKSATSKAKRSGGSTNGKPQ